MKAVVLHEYGGPDHLKYEDWPDPTPGEGEVLVLTAAASVNPVDCKMRSGAAASRFPVNFPGILGRDVSGVVRAVGPASRASNPAMRSSRWPGRPTPNWSLSKRRSSRSFLQASTWCGQPRCRW
jgi:NADPH:quinone reductase-like Zn-dependent oxidoreductase